MAETLIFNENPAILAVPRMRGTDCDGYRRGNGEEGND